MEGFRFTTPYSVRSADINSSGHVSNAAVMNYLQDARIAYLGQVGACTEREVGGGCGLIMAEARVRYLAEMFLGDVLEIGVRVTELGRTSFRLSYRIEREGAATAEGETAVVVFEYASRKPREIPPALRRAMAEFEGLPATP